MSTAKKTNPAKWKRIVAAVKAGIKGGRAGQWSARKAQIAVARYKKSGGGYSGAKTALANGVSRNGEHQTERSLKVKNATCQTQLGKH